MESFFGTLKTECLHYYRFATRKELRRVVFEYIEVFCASKEVSLGNSRINAMPGLTISYPLIVRNNATNQRFNWLHSPSTYPSTKSGLSRVESRALERARFAAHLLLQKPVYARVRAGSRCLAGYRAVGPEP